MTIETNELILAAHVRVIAQEKRQAAYQAAAAQVAAQYPEVAVDKSWPAKEQLAHMEAESDKADQRRNAVANMKGSWYSTHPLEDFVPAAVAELANIAALIKANRAS